MAEYAPKITVDPETGEIVEVPLTPEEVAQRDADAAHGATLDLARGFELADDAERLRVINERARTDPAYAALADIVLGKGL